MLDNQKLRQHPPKILVIGPSWVGDMVMAQSLFIVIKAQYHGAVIDVLAPAWSCPIIERMPEVNQAISMPLGHGRFAWKERKAVGHQLRQAHYSQAIVLPNSWKSALIPWFANIPVRTGWSGEARYGLLNDRRTLNKDALPLMVQRFVALAYDAKNPHPLTIEHCPAPSLQANTPALPALLAKLSLTTDTPLLILCPGAEFGPAKQWPANHYANVATKMIQQGWQVWVMGSSGDVAIANEIGSLTGGQVTNLCGKTSLEEAIDLLSLAQHVVSNDSGLMHIASALNRPLTAVYGATSPAFTPPLSQQARILSIEVDCGPCFKRECPLGHHKCMQSLQAEQVLEHLI